jgi:hypothetical protein
MLFGAAADGASYRSPGFAAFRAMSTASNYHFFVSQVNGIHDGVRRTTAFFSLIENKHDLLNGLVFPTTNRISIRMNRMNH